MKVRFQADADLNEDIVSGVIRRVPEIDFQNSQEAGLVRLSDPAVLRLAASQNRVLVTHDRRTMPINFGKFIETEPCPGVLVVSQDAPVLAVIEDLILIWTVSEAEEYVNSIRTLPL